MMTRKKNIIIPTSIGLFLFMTLNAIAGDPPPVGGDPTTDPGATPIGGSAPIGDGYLFLVVLVLIYYTIKYYHFIKLKENI